MYGEKRLDISCKSFIGSLHSKVWKNISIKTSLGVAVNAHVSHFGTYCIHEQLMLRKACTSGQFPWNLLLLVYAKYGRT